MALPHILLIDCDRERIQQFEIILSFMQYSISIADASNYLAKLNEIDDLRVVFIGNGCEKQAAVVKDVLENTADIPVVFLLKRRETLQLASALKKRVYSYLEWPTSHDLLSTLLKQLPAVDKPVASVKTRSGNYGLSGSSEQIINIRQLIEQVAKSDATVLVLGESGTGKEVVAQAIHRASTRKDKPFVPINCGAIPGELLESELFGHEKGAFTGALTARQGRFELAEGGTLFLDEIGDMPLPMQVKLLRVLQEKTFERVGSNSTIKCDVRIIAATHRQLENEIKEKRFREDLFYRLNVFPIEIPALRERKQDIPLLVTDLTARMQQAKQTTVEFSSQALAMLMQHPWPGNIRELSNFIERMAITNSNTVIEVDELPEKFQVDQVSEDILSENLDIIRQQEQQTVEKVNQVFNLDEPNQLVPLNPSQLSSQGIDLKNYLNDLEINLIEQALKECNGVVAHAAKLLNMRRTTLVEKLRKYELS